MEISKTLYMIISILPATFMTAWPCGVVVNMLAFGASDSSSNLDRAAQFAPVV